MKPVHTHNTANKFSQNFQLPCAVVQQAKSPARNRGAIIDTFTTIRDAIREPVLKMALAMAMTDEGVVASYSIRNNDDVVSTV